MHKSESSSAIAQLQKNWTNKIAFSNALFALGSATLLIAVGRFAWPLSWWWILPLCALFFIVPLFLANKKIEEKDVAAFLNSALPGMQESTHLLLKDPAELNFLENLQVKKIETAINASIATPPYIQRRTRWGLIWVMVSLATVALSCFFPFSKQTVITTNTPIAITENKPAEIKQALLTIHPPAYLQKADRKQDQFNVTVEEDGELTWHITTTKKVNSIQLLFNDKSVLTMRPADAAHTIWQAAKKIVNPGFYQVKIDSGSSELYRVDMVHDQYPVINVIAPKPNSLIEAGHAQTTKLDVSLSDDYGIKATSISATIASGNGEAVKFKKQNLVFTDFNAGGKQYQLKKGIDLAALGMKPGDELYFYITATDTRGQEKKSDIYIVRIEDNAQLLSIDGIVNGLDIKPELFRSQRQIIIETEQLIKDKDTIRIEDFKTRSNNLGIDQSLLRLRYGKFLGEETNAEIGHEADHEHHGTHEESAVGNAQQMIDEISHKHDNAEDATFFDAQTKKQLKATLDEMWKAELQLRIFKPKDALPFEYKALKLLKDLQQQTRVYVAKTSSRLPPLKLDKRLTGELDKIIQPVTQQSVQKEDVSIVLRQALGILEQVKSKEKLSPASMDILEKAGIQVGNKAAEEPGAYLKSFESFRKILANQYTSPDIDNAIASLQKIIRTAPKVPAQSGSSADKKLSQQYFINLNHANE